MEIGYTVLSFGGFFRVKTEMERAALLEGLYSSESRSIHFPISMDDRLKPPVESADEVLRKSPSRRYIAFCLVVHLVSEDLSLRSCNC